MKTIGMTGTVIIHIWEYVNLKKKGNVKNERIYNNK